MLLKISNKSNSLELIKYFVLHPNSFLLESPLAALCSEISRMYLAYNTLLHRIIHARSIYVQGIEKLAALASFNICTVLFGANPLGTHSGNVACIYNGAGLD